MRGAHARGQLVRGVRAGIIVAGDRAQDAGAIGVVGGHLIGGHAGIAVRGRQAGVAPGDIGSVVDQVLGDAVPAGGLNIAVGMIDHTLPSGGPSVGQDEVRRELSGLLLRIDAMVETVAVIDVHIAVEAALDDAQRDRRTALGGDLLLIITASGDADVARRRGQIHGGLGNEVQQAADLAGAVDGIGRATDDLDLRGVANGRRIGAPVLNALEALEIVLSQGAANIQ